MSKQAIRDRVRILNKHVTNKILILFAGKKFGHFAILTHTGRKTGKVYKTPIIAEPIENGFMIALTYGKKVDWLANVLAKGSCSLYWKEKEYTLSRPEIVGPEIGLKAFPLKLSKMLRKAGVEYFLKLSILQERNT